MIIASLNLLIADYSTFQITAQQVDAILALNITELLEQIKTGRLTASEVLTAYQIKVSLLKIVQLIFSVFIMFQPNDSS